MDSFWRKRNRWIFSLSNNLRGSMPLYNRAEYDVQEYNANSLSLSLSDSSTLSSNLGGFSENLTKTEILSLISTLNNLVDRHPLVDTLSVSDPSSFQLDRYGSVQYNTVMYNNRMFGPRRRVIRATSESMSISDINIVNSMIKILTEAVTSGSVISIQEITVVLDSVFMSEYFRRELTNKALGDTLRLATWFEIIRRPAEEVF
jgi:hypothetical protein